MKEQTEFAKFDAALSKVLSVSHDELVRREQKWKKQRKQSRKRREKKA
jgi:hypothetical protein